MGDVFQDHLDACKAKLKEALGDKFAAKDDHCSVFLELDTSFPSSANT